jgi:hypothetical protein
MFDSCQAACDETLSNLTKLPLVTRVSELQEGGHYMALTPGHIDPLKAL